MRSGVPGSGGDGRQVCLAEDAQASVRGSALGRGHGVLGFGSPVPAVTHPDAIGVGAATVAIRRGNRPGDAAAGTLRRIPCTRNASRTVTGAEAAASLGIVDCPAPASHPAEHSHEVDHLARGAGIAEARVASLATQALPRSASRHREETGPRSRSRRGASPSRLASRRCLDFIGRHVSRGTHGAGASSGDGDAVALAPARARVTSERTGPANRHVRYPNRQHEQHALNPEMRRALRFGMRGTVGSAAHSGARRSCHGFHSHTESSTRASRTRIRRAQRHAGGMRAARRTKV